MTYQAIITGDKVTWLGEPPPQGDKPLRARIDLDDQREIKGTDGKVLVAVLERIISDTGGVTSISDPVAWQREQRMDRPMPGREP